LAGALGKLAATVLRSEFVKAWILMVLALMLPVVAMAEEKEGEPKVAYINLSPPFVGNYALDGGPKAARVQG